MDLISNIPVISLRGDSYSRGLELGRKARDIILRNVRYYLYLWSTYSKMDRSDVIKMSSDFIPVIEKYDSDILEEMKGVAEGAGVSLQEIVAINCRYEFVWAQMQFASGSGPPHECTAIGATPEVTESRHTLLGQNWDYRPSLRDGCIVLEELQEPEKPNIVMHTEAGILGQKGLNSAGIGVCVNALISDRDQFKPKTPFWVMVRGALNQRTLDQAMLAVTSTGRAGSGNVMLAQEAGEIVDLELTPDDFGFMFPEDGLISHANNFVHPQCMARVIDKVKVVEPGSLIRTNRSRRLLRTHCPKISIQDFQEVLKDHFGYPNSICCHPDPNYHVDYQRETTVSLIFDLEERSVTISRGQPCINTYQTVKPESLRYLNRNDRSD